MLCNFFFIFVSGYRICCILRLPSNTPPQPQKMAVVRLTALEATRLEKYKCYKRALARGHTSLEAASIAQVPARTARSWMRNGPPGKRGRKVKDMTSVTKKLIKLATMTMRRGSRTIPRYPTAIRIAVQMKRRYRIAISRHHVLRLLKKEGFVSRVRPRHPSVANTRKRLEFAQRWLHFPSEKLIFSDEHWISTNDSSHRRQIVAKGTEPLPRDHQRRQNIPNFQIWAAIGVGWRSPLVFLPQYEDSDKKKGYRLNAERYIELCLRPNLRALSRKGFVFMQDGAKCHTANATKNWLREHKITLMDGYPASSPDFNPIEEVWGLLNERIAEKMPTTKTQLRKAAIRAWEEIPQRVLNNYVRSFSGRVQRSCANNGL